MRDFDGNEEVSTKVEEAIDMKYEFPGSSSFPPFQTENEVSVISNCLLKHVIEGKLEER
jgi:hypothetical protein